MTFDRVVAVLTLVVSTLLSIAVFLLGAQISKVDRERQSVVDGSLTEAAALQACLDYQRFVIEQKEAGRSQEQISALVGGTLALQVGEYQYVRECPGVAEVFNAVDGVGFPTSTASPPS